MMEFPTKLDFLIADLDNDGVITSHDLEYANDETLIWARCIVLDAVGIDQSTYQLRQGVETEDPGAGDMDEDEEEEEEEEEEEAPDIDPYDELTKGTWWHDKSEVKVWCRINDNPVTLTWDRNWELQLELPEEYFELQTVLTYLGVNQRRFRERVSQFQPQVVQTYTDLHHNAPTLMKNTHTLTALGQRLDHVNRTYVRL